MVAGAGLLMCAYVALWSGCDVGGGDKGASEPAARALRLPRAGVAGYLAAVPRRAGEEELGVDEPIFIPNVRVWLRDPATGVTTPAVRTDLSGRFVLPPQPQGDYELCWAARGFVSGCGMKDVAIRNDHVYLKTLPLELQGAAGAGAFFGRVRFADGSIPRSLEPLANVNAFATVGVRGSRRRAYVNSFGDYVLAGVRLVRPVVLEAVIEDSAKLVRVDPAALPAGRAARVDFTIANHAPTGVSIAGVLPGGRRWSAPPGASVTLAASASDEDGDALRYRWIGPDGSSPVSVTGPTFTTRLPRTRGLFEYTVVAYDRRGGYSRGFASISTDSVRFAGTVGATNAPVVPGAEVAVNGKRTRTNGDGHFEISVPERRRFVLNIRKPGYGLVSRIYDAGVTGGHWTLTRASISTLDSTSAIDVTNERVPSDCPGRLSLRKQDGLGRENAEQPGECGPGIRLLVPPNSLVDANGNPPTGDVDVELSTVDLEAPDAMPGDFTSRDANGAFRTMESYGAGTIEIRGGGKEYNLARGKTATVVFPIDSAQLASGAPIPSTIPLLVYNERSGIWVERGQARRAGNTYVARVGHLSALNVDLQFVNPACVRLETVLMPPQFRLEVTIPSNTPGGAPVVRYLDVDNSLRRHHLLWRMPTNRVIELRAFQLPPSNAPIHLLGLNPAFPISVVAADTGGPQQPPTPAEPPFPYEACRGFLPESPTIFIVKLVGAGSLPGVNTNFLTGLYSFKAANLSELDRLTPGGQGPWRRSSYAYVTTIDPLGLRENFAEFKSRNRFPTGEVRAVYANFSDLGLGREMHCKRTAVAGLSGYDVACYVTNYGYAHTNDRQDFLDAAAGLGLVTPPPGSSPSGPVTTVAMEYSRIEDPSDPSGNTFVNNTRIVKFYVYKPYTFGGPIIRRDVTANLDGFTERPVPQVCMVCHGGRYQSGPSPSVPTWSGPASVNLGSQFLPFDLTSFELPTVDHDNSPGTPPKNFKADQQTRFKRLNIRMVLATNPVPSIRRVVEKMYGASVGGTTFPRASQDESFVIDSPPPGWTASRRDEEMYRTVVGPTCRTCHIAQGASISWDQASTFKGYGTMVASYVCELHVMPHALMTHRRFWLSVSPQKPVRLYAYLNTPPPIHPLGRGCATSGP